MAQSSAKKLGLLGAALSFESIVGLAVGGAAAWYLYSKMEGDDLPKPDPNRKFQLDELANYSGSGQRLCYIAIGDAIYNVTADKGKFLDLAGKHTPVEAFSGDLDEIKTKYDQVGTLIIPREMTKLELATFDGTDGKPVYVCAKGVIYEVDPGFYGPEGPYSMMAGKDASRAFALTSLDPADVENPSIEDLGASALSTLEEWIAKLSAKYNVVGYLIDDATGIAPAAPKRDLPSYLNKKRQKVKLVEKINLSHDTRLFRFEIPHPGHKLGLPIGKHIKIWCPTPKGVVDGEWNGAVCTESKRSEVERKYTPSSLDDENPGFLDIVIKVYKSGVVERFPDGGKMSQYLDSVKIGDTIDIAGPYGLIEYQGKGTFTISKKERKVKYVGMLAGGTGITPMLQLIKAVLRDPEDQTKLSLIFANQTEEDILVRDMLETEAQKHPDRFKLHYTVDRPPADWKYSTGFIDADMITKYMPPPGDDTVIFMCGPPPMIKFACKANLDKLGYDKKAQVEF
mmetsp:Transcript_9692/g.17053  ORF Transcript_9692/g.17053 Transcript_9692/m.17053 type:complete len:511 (-) Transcript_9692:25-1557(-)